MVGTMPRKTTPKVKAGRVQKKNNWALTTDMVLLAGTAVAFERRRPGPGYRHLLRRSDLESFIALLPDWDELAVGLQVVILDAGECETDGWHVRGAIAICAWERELWIDYAPEFVAEHQAILDRLEVEIQVKEHAAIVRWTEPQARAFQLLHVFLHELGHHHDRMTTRSEHRAARGEHYAEAYAVKYAEQIWHAYEESFSW
jgi:hypothetical protein